MKSLLFWLAIVVFEVSAELFQLQVETKFSFVFKSKNQFPVTLDQTFHSSFQAFPVGNGTAFLDISGKDDKLPPAWSSYLVLVPSATENCHLKTCYVPHQPFISKTVLF